MRSVNKLRNGAAAVYHPLAHPTGESCGLVHVGSACSAKGAAHRVWCALWTPGAIVSIDFGSREFQLAVGLQYLDGVNSRRQRPHTLGRPINDGNLDFPQGAGRGIGEKIFRWTTRPPSGSSQASGCSKQQTIPRFGTLAAKRIPGARLVIGVPTRTWASFSPAVANALRSPSRRTSSPGGLLLYPQGGLDAFECNSRTAT